MEISKEREAFDQYFKEKYQEFHNEVFDENGDDRAIIGYSFAWSAWQAAKAQATPEGFVLVPRECPDPIFADKLFDHLCKKAHGEFGDDQMIFFSDIDESAIWQLMIEAQEQSHDNSN